MGRKTYGGLVAGLAIAVLAAVSLGGASARAAGTPPTFNTFVAPAPLGRDAGEPSIGSNWSTGNVMYQAGLETLRVNNFDDVAKTATWTSVGSTITSTTSLDPILFTDHSTGRTFVSQLSADCSLMAFTDNDGASWFQNPVGCGLASGADHQTVGGGAFAPGLSGTGYPDTVYYCAQAIATAQCSLSLNGGVSFNPAVPIYSAVQCGGLHGHIKSAPDGTVYVPNADCGGKQAVVASTDNGTTWAVRTVPGSTTQDESDPSVAVGAGNTVYLGWQDGASNTTGSTAKVAVSRDRGRTWTNVQDVGASLGIKNVQFPAMVAGDDDKAALAFLGTTTAGNDQAAGFTGAWHLYVAATYDGGVTWSTVDVTPSDPVQRGCIWMAGGSNKCRNLLDFMDATVDKQGRILVGYADGCVSACVTGTTNSYTAIATIARQSGGTTLFATPPA
jgi:hypothetical protein